MSRLRTWRPRTDQMIRRPSRVRSTSPASRSFARCWLAIVGLHPAASARLVTSRGVSRSDRRIRTRVGSASSANAVTAALVIVPRGDDPDPFAGHPRERAQRVEVEVDVRASQSIILSSLVRAHARAAHAVTVLAACVAQVADQADDVLGHEPPDRAGGVDADDHLRRPGRARSRWTAGTRRSGSTNAPVAAETAAASALCPTGKVRPCFAIRSCGGGLVVDRQRDDLRADLGEAVGGALEGAQLGVAVRAPRPAVEQHHAEPAVERIGQRTGRGRQAGQGEGRERVSRV